MSNQWEGIRFAKGSAGNEMSHTDIANTCQGLRLDSLANLSMTNCRVTNSGTSADHRRRSHYDGRRMRAEQRGRRHIFCSAAANTALTAALWPTGICFPSRPWP